MSTQIPSIEEFIHRHRSLTWYLDNLPLAIAIFRVLFDDGGQPVDLQFAYVNEELIRLNGRERSRLQGAFFYRDIFPDGDRKWLDFHARVATTGAEACCRELSPEVGHYLEVHASSPCYGYCFCTVINISERLNAEQNLREFQNGIATLLSNQLATFLFYDIDRRTIYNNIHTRLSRQISGRHPSVIPNIPQSLVRIGVLRAEDAQRLQDGILTPMEQGASEAELEMLLNLAAADGMEDWQWYHVSMHKYISVMPNVRRAVCAVRTIQSEVDLRNSLRSKADADSLTGLYNRAAAEEVIAGLLEEQEGPFLLSLFDLDDFKLINDCNGHVCGDNVLFFFAQLLKGLLDDHIVFRLGGDEFAAFACGQTPESVTDLCAQVMESLDRQDRFPFRIGCSCGVAWSRKACSYGELYALADRALYASKGEGKNGWHVLSLEEQPEDMARAQADGQSGPADSTAGQQTLESRFPHLVASLKASVRAEAEADANRRARETLARGLRARFGDAARAMLGALEKIDDGERLSALTLLAMTGAPLEEMQAAILRPSGEA